MKPRNKRQREIIALSNALPEITAKQKADSIKMHKDYCMVTYKTRSHCLNCGNTWKGDNSIVRKTKKAICPKCKKELRLKENASWYVEKRFYGIITTINDMQLVRIFLSEKDMRKNEEASHSIREVIQHWINPEGKILSISVNIANSMSWEKTWGYGELEFRSEGGYGYSSSWKNNHGCDRVWHERKMIPILRRNGFKGSTHGVIPHQLFRMLILDNKVESLWKMGQYGLAEAVVYERLKPPQYWASIMTLIRNNYKLSFHQVGVWTDYIDLLLYFNKDIRSPKYVCPNNLKMVHDRLVAKKAKLDKAEKLELQKARILIENVEYQKQKKKFFDLCFKDGQLIVEPLKTVEEFLESGSKFHHCLYTNSYYKKDHNLIFSAKMKDELIENVNVSLNNFQLVESRGLQNKPSKYNGQIIELVKKNLDLIRKTA